MLLLHGGLLIDGSGRPGAAGDLLLDGDRIVQVGRFQGPGDCERVDCTGLVVTPGFIDLHSHSDLQVLARHRAKTDQGVTSEVVGNCGFSAYPCGDARTAVQQFANGILCGHGRDWGWPDARAYLADAAAEASLVSVHSLVGHGTLRVAFDGELNAMEKSLAESLEGGAAGFSTGLMYQPGSEAPPEELAALCRVTAQAAKLYTTHMRSYGDDLLPALDEQIALARAAGCRLQISHLQAVGRRNWDRQAEALAKLEQATDLDVAFDSYPYLAGSTVLTQLLPAWAMVGGIPALLGRLTDPALRTRINAEMFGQMPQDPRDVFITSAPATPEMVGRSLGEIDNPAELLRANDAAVNILSFNQSDQNLRGLLTHPLSSIISDGFFVNGKPHPRLYGTFPFLLGEFVRRRQWLTLEQAVHKITAQPAARLGLTRHGLLQTGYAADVTVFDPNNVAAGATYESPELAPVGIHSVYRAGKRISPV